MITLLRAYGGFASGSIVMLPDNTEAALITQGLATAVATNTNTEKFIQSGTQFVNSGGNIAIADISGQSTPVAVQGPSILTNTSLGNTALTAQGTSSAHTAGSVYFSEIYIPHWNVWKGIAVLNGTTASTDNLIGALYNTNGQLVANSALAGTLSANASTFEQLAFVTSVLLAPGRYFGAVQCNGTTATTMKFVTANSNDKMTGSTTGVFGTLPTTITVPTTFTTAVGPVFQLYT